jgi:threonine/homoserine/homoserine lactone efflux protein
MTTAELTALLALATATSFTPGPNTTLSASLGAQGGVRFALPFVLSVPVGWSLLLALCVLGLGAVVREVPALRLAITVAGVGYLLWLAWRLATRATLPAAGERPLVGFWGGVALQFLNIKAWFLALAMTAGWIAGQPDAFTRWLVVWPILAAFAFTSNLSYAWLGSALNAWLGHGSRLQAFNRTMALVLILTAGWLWHSAT